MNFEWNENKAALNLKKHGVSFVEAATVITSHFSVNFQDPDSHGEFRVITIGFSSQDRLLLVVHTERIEGSIRIISARKATSHERKIYAQKL